MIKEITQYLEDETTLVIDTNLFAGFVPPTIVADYVVVVDTGGVPSFFTPDYVEKTIQVLSKARTYENARLNAYAVYDVLHGSSGITLPTVSGGQEYYANTINAVALPQSVGQDEKGMFVFSTNFVLKIQNN